MGRLRRNGDEARDALDGAGRRVKQGFRQRQRDQGGGVRDRNRAAQDKDDELGGIAAAAMSGTDRLPGASRPSGAEGASNVANGDRLVAQLTGLEIAGGHAFDKHVFGQAEYPGVRTRREFADLITDVVSNGRPRPLDRGRIAYWLDGTIVIRNPLDVDGGTAFRPVTGIEYFLSSNL